MKLDDFHVVVDYQQYAVCGSSELAIPLSSTSPFVAFVSYCPYVLLSPRALNKNYLMLIRQHLVFLQICYCSRGMAL